MSRRSAIGPSLHWLLLGGLLGLALLLILSRPLPTNDYSIYVAMGRQMLATGTLLERDPFSFTQPGVEFQHASWAYALLCACSHEAFGYQGIRVLVAGAALVTLAGVWVLARRAGAGPRAAVLAVLYAWVLLLQNLGVRGQTLVYPLFLALVALTQRPLRPWLGAVVGLLLGWIWTQLHGSFPVALLYCGAVTVGAAVNTRSLRAAVPGAALGVGLLAGTLLGPYGPWIWSYIHSNGAIPRERGILEWYPPALISFEGARLSVALLAWAGVLTWRRGRMGFDNWLLLLGFGCMALSATRIIAWFGLATALPLAVMVTAPGRRHQPAPALPRPQRAVLAVLGLAWVALLAQGVPRQVELAADTPVALAERLAEEPTGGRVFAPMEAGGYLAWRFHSPSADPSLPLGVMEHPTFLDMRVWIWPDPIWEEFLAISAAEPGWQERLDAWEVRYLLLSHSFHGAGLLPAVGHSPRWEPLAEDSAGALYRRVD